MIITLCLLTLVSIITGRNPRTLLKKLQGVNWSANFEKLKRQLRHYAAKAGRASARPLLTLYYVVADEETTTLEKAMIYGCLVYVMMPIDLLPRSVYKLLGVADDMAALAFVMKKVASKTTPEIRTKVETTLDDWFGIEVDIVK